ncbi:MAG TPA: bifunctional adenosylcobinamide kinase/adenosylcobinamide-phosphate guanylyltransferase [Bacilli bacterium]|nr:bifunctional adenosylcobinamide kinase/adenosylcobinamide-phosphate guanylyltransferase [Bacilli bacterium]
MSYVLVTGGVRSGKSRYAERLAGEERRVLYVATGVASDGEMSERIRLHQERRPAKWGLLEVGEDQLVERLRQSVEWKRQKTDGVNASQLVASTEHAFAYEVLLIDCLSAWLSTLLIHLPESEWRSLATKQRVLAEAESLADWLQKTPLQAVVVTTETGLGGVAMSPLGRAFQDLLGEVNQILAHQAADVFLVVAGRALRLPEEGVGL